MPVHVAIAAQVHQDVEAELLSGAERAQYFVVLAAMPQSEVDDLAANVFACTLDRLANLSIGIMAVLVNQRSGQFHFEWFSVEQINRGRGGDR